MFKKLDFLIFGWFINLCYPEYYRPKYGYQRYYILFFHYLIPQKIYRLNPKVKWPVHYTSRVIAPNNIQKGILCDPGDNINNYIQANNGIIFGNNIELAPGVSIISSNHKATNLRKHTNGKPIIIGNNVWIGEYVNLYSLDFIEIEDNVVVSQYAFLCTGSHDVNNKFKTTAGPILVKRETWICTKSIILKDVTISQNQIIGAGPLIKKSI